MTKRARQQGELENLVLETLWDANRPLTSNEVLELCNVGSELALTTILTVLTRLLDKELVSRAPAAKRGFLFSATSTREEYAAKQLLMILQNSDNPALTLSHFTSGLSKKSLAALKKSLE